MILTRRFVNRRCTSLWLGLVVILLHVQCARPHRHPEQLLWYPSELVPQADAVDGSVGPTASGGGTASVVLRGRADREQVSDALIQHFRQEHWEERSTQWLNPRSPTMFASGWRCGPPPGGLFADSEAMRGYASQPAPILCSFKGEWQDAHGDVLEYSMRETDGDVEVYAVFMPAASIREVEAKKRRTRTLPAR